MYLQFSHDYHVQAKYSTTVSVVRWFTAASMDHLCARGEKAQFVHCLHIPFPELYLEGQDVANPKFQLHFGM